MHAAIALCRRPVAVYGAGLLSHRSPAQGAGADKVYSHVYDEGAGRCVNLSRAARFLGPRKDVRRMRWVEKTKWRRQRVQGELLLHLLHALGMIRWVQ
jgi:hypothetical protein